MIRRGSESSRSSMRPTRICAASRAMSTSGWRTVVSANASQLRHRDVVEARDRDAFGDRDPQPPRRVQGAEGDHIVGAEDRCRRVLAVEQLRGALEARLVGEPAGAPEGGVERDARARERVGEPGLAIAARRGVRRAGDERDAPVAEREQVVCHRRRAADVIGHHAVDGGARDVAVEQHARHSRRGSGAPRPPGRSSPRERPRRRRRSC